MPTVRCPRCKTAQHVEAGSAGYSCSSCGTDWGFVVCRSCGSRFHSKPGATTWTCPRCGLLQDASAEPPLPTLPEPAPTAPAPTAPAPTAPTPTAPTATAPTATAPAPTAPTPLTITDADLDRPQEPPGSAFPPGLGLGSDDEGPEDAFAMPTRASSGRPPWVWIVAGLIAIAVAVVAFNALFGGEEGGDAGTTPSGGAVTVEEATATMCGHVRQTQVFRVQALAQAEDVLKADAKTLKQAGDPQAAKQVRSLITATEDLRQALADQQDTSEVLAAQADAIAALPCG